MVNAKFGGQTECIRGDSKIENFLFRDRRARAELMIASARGSRSTLSRSLRSLARRFSSFLNLMAAFMVLVHTMF